MTNRRRQLKQGLTLLPVVSLAIPFLQAAPVLAADCDPATDLINTTLLGSTLVGTSGQDICNLDPGSISTTNEAGVYAFDGGGITNTGTISTAGDGSFGAFAIAGGDVINTGNISTTGGKAIGAYALDGGDVINTGNVSTTGDTAFGIHAADGGDVTNSGNISTTGDKAFGAESDSGGNATNTGNISTAGDDAVGLAAYGGGDATNTGNIFTIGDTANGVFADGNVTNMGAITTTGVDAIGILTSSPDNTVYNSGIVTSTNAKAIYLDDGNDTLILAGNAAVNGLMDGGANTDTLDFSLNVDEKYYDEVVAELNALIASGSPDGTITISGHTFDWVSFENLVNSLHREITSFKDERINRWDFQQTMTGWCVDSGERGYAFYNINASSQGQPLLNVTNAQINAALEKAAASGAPVLLGEKNGKSVWALPSHELQMHDGAPGGTYNYVWTPEVCGSYTK